jgi:hypothetical protein
MIHIIKFSKQVRLTAVLDCYRIPHVVPLPLHFNFRLVSHALCSTLPTCDKQRRNLFHLSMMIYSGNSIRPTNSVSRQCLSPTDIERGVRTNVDFDFGSGGWRRRPCHIRNENNSRIRHGFDLRSGYSSCFPFSTWAACMFATSSSQNVSQTELVLLHLNQLTYTSHTTR